MKKELLNNPIVKTLLNVGFSEDYIEKGLESGEIKLEKSKTEEEMSDSEDKEKRNIDNDENHIEDLKKDVKEDKKDVEDLKEDKKEKMEKAFSEDLLKSFGESVSENLIKALTPIFTSLNERLDSQETLMKSISKETPSFKGADLNKASFLEKSMESFKDEEGKMTVDIVKQRSLAKKLIEKSLEDDEIVKSFGDKLGSYLMYPEADTLDEGFSRYAYDKLNVKFVK